MNKTVIYARTAKGARTAAAADELAPGLRNILNAIDGTSPVEVLRGKLDDLSAAKLDDALATLVGEGLIHESSSALIAAGDGTEQSTLQSDEHLRKAQELRAKLRGRREGVERRAGQDPGRQETERRAAPEADARRGEDQARRDAEEQSRREAAERIRLEAEAQTRRAADEQQASLNTQKRARQDAEEAARSAAEERAWQEAQDLARRIGDDRIRRETGQEPASTETEAEAEERAWREAQDLARRIGEDRARLEGGQQAEQETGRETATAAGQEAGPPDGAEEAERERLEAEAQLRLMAEEQAWLEAEEKARREQEAAASRLANAKAAAQRGPAPSRKLRKWGKALALGLLVLLAAGLVTIHLISFDGQIPAFEKSVAAQLQQPVKIRALRLALLPQPRLRLEGVSIGSAGQIRVPHVDAPGDLGNLFSDRKVFKSIELQSPVVTEEGLGWILFGKPLARDMVSGQVSALNVSIETKNVGLPAFNAKLQAGGEGAWKTIGIESTDRNLALELTQKGQSVQIGIKARSFKIPFGSALTLDDFVANGTVERGGLALGEFKGFVHGGTLAGSARLKWGANWSLAGELNAKQIDMTRLVPELLNGGRLAGSATYAMQAPEAARLFAAPQLEGSFSIPWGTLLGIDLGQFVQGGEKRGETRFTELSGSFVHDRGVTQLRQVRLNQATLSATGMLDVDAQKTVRGHFAADLKLSTEQRHANLVLSGTLGKIEWRLQ